MISHLSNKFLYSRSQFWFDLNAGGSVGHTKGIIHGLNQFGEVSILSNDYLYGVKKSSQKILHPWFKKPYTIAEFIYNIPYYSFIKKNIKEINPNVIYHRYSGLSYATSMIAKEYNIPLILEYNGSEQWMSKFWSEKKIKNRILYPIRSGLINIIEKYNLKTATLIIVVSEVSRNLLLELGVPSNKILINPNGVNPDQFCPLDNNKMEKIKFNLGIPIDNVVVGFSGTFGEWHGIPDIAQAIELLNRDHYYRDRLFFIFFGDGKLRSYIQEKVNKYPNVFFTGIIPYDEMPSILSICDIFLSPHGKTPDGGRFFGSPTKLFEYMSMAKGIIASNLDQIGEVITHKNTGWLIEPGNVFELVEGIRVLADDAKFRNSLGRAAREKVISLYTWSAHVKRTLDALRDLKVSDGKLL